MKPTMEWLDPIIWTLLGLSALALLAGADERRRSLRLLGSLLLLVGTLALMAGLAVPTLLPERSALMQAGGGSADPRILSALLASLAGLALLVPAWRALRLPALGNVSVAIPGVVLAGILGAIAYFAGLHLPLAQLGIVLGAFLVATAVTLVLRSARPAAVAGPLVFALGVGVCAAAGMLSLHGARIGGIAIPVGSAVDTLGHRLYLAGIDAPASDLRRLNVVVYGERDSLKLQPELRGATGRNVKSVAAAALFSGPIVVPIQLEERRAQAHDLQWVDRSTPLQAGTATIALKGFRFVKGDTIRMYADLDVTTAKGRYDVSPGVFATAQGEIPFAADAPGFGPIAVARIDADHGRVGLMLPQLSEANVTRIALLDLRLRPALPYAWAGAALALVGFLLALVSNGGTPRRH